MKRLLFAVIAIALFGYACSSGETTEENSDSAAACKPKPLNPNGDSELAILMREMASWMDSCKVAIVEKKSPPSTPPSFQMLKTAKRTDPNIDESIYQSMAHLFVTKVADFESKADSTKFNQMVDACVSCHKNFCQGPLVRINKMYFQ